MPTAITSSLKSNQSTQNSQTVKEVSATVDERLRQLLTASRYQNPNNLYCAIQTAQYVSSQFGWATATTYHRRWSLRHPRRATKEPKRTCRDQNACSQYQRATGQAG